MSIPESISSKSMAQVRELILSDAESFEMAVTARLDKLSEPLSLYIIDLREISGIFARSGQSESSRFLRTVGELLMSICKEQDSIHRIGEYTFVVLLSGLESIIHQQMAAEKIIRLQNEAVRGMGSHIIAGICMGISSCHEHTGDAAELIQNARIALESAQSKGMPYVIFSAESTSEMSIKWHLQEELATAIKAKHFDLHYQPKVDALTGRPIGAEALLRWTNEANEPVPPDVFIPVAREIGLMSELTRFVLTTALRESAKWPDFGYRYNVSVNLEASSFHQTDIKDIVSSSLSIFGGDNCDLTLEITESTLITDSEHSFQTLNALRALGVGISIDDFGTGYSSFSYFKDIPATELKIDKSFISRMLESRKDLNLVETIIMLAHRFDLSVVAEGVENSDELEALRDMKCDYIQGYLVSKALPNNEYCEWLAEQGRSHQSA